MKPFNSSYKTNPWDLYANSNLEQNGIDPYEQAMDQNSWDSLAALQAMQQGGEISAPEVERNPASLIPQKPVQMGLPQAKPVKNPEQDYLKMIEDQMVNNRQNIQEYVQDQRAMTRDLNSHKAQVDLSPAIAFFNNWTGGNTLKGYTKPQSQEEHQMQVQQLKNGILKAQQGLSDDEINIFKTKYAAMNDEKWKNKNYNLEREKLNIQKSAAKRNFDVLPKENQIQIADIAKDSANKKAITANLAAGFKIISDPKLTDDQKLVHARSMIKTLNSTQGKDAVGAEESKRLGSLLEFQFANLTGPGPAFGRAPMSEFANQIKSKVDELNSSINTNNSMTQQLYGREPSDDIKLPTNEAPKPGFVKDGYRYNGGKLNDPQNWVKI